MDLRNFFQGNIQADPESRLQELLRAIFVRTQFVPGVRHAIGWRGLKQESAAVEGWTARIRGWAGVFGLHFEGRRRRRAGSRAASVCPISLTRMRTWLNAVRCSPQHTASDRTT